MVIVENKHYLVLLLARRIILGAAFGFCSKTLGRWRGRIVRPTNSTSSFYDRLSGGGGALRDDGTLGPYLL